MSSLQGLRRSLVCSIPAKALRFSTSSALRANRAIYFETTGDPSHVLSALTFPSLPAPPSGSVNVRFRLSPINPSDVNVVEGVYPSKPSGTQSLAEGHSIDNTIYVPGNEGLAEVTDIGSGVADLQRGDWVILSKQQGGTWASARTIAAEDVVKVPTSLSEVNAATITVNPATAFNMLHDFVKLQEGDWIIQNGKFPDIMSSIKSNLSRMLAANSAVGQAVIQIAARKGWKTLNFVRNRKDIEALKEQLTTLGATQVVTYDDLNDRSLRDKVREWTGGKPIRLMLNGVGGQPTMLMSRFLGNDAHLVTYGGMSKQPLSLPTGAFIFKNLTTHGFWQSRWYKEKSREEREDLMRVLADLKLQEPAHEVLTIAGKETDEVAGAKVRQAIQKMGEGQYGKKILLRVEQPDG